MAFHFAIRAVPGTVLFRTHAEARALWERLVAAFPRMLALCLMPDHIHLVLPDADADRRLPAVLSGYARWRNGVRGESGAVFASHDGPKEVPDGDHLRRTIRYVHLNAARKGLVADPLDWPWSTHRDAVGLAFPAAIERRRDRTQFHSYVTSDPQVSIVGTELPILRHEDFSIEQVADTVAGICRVPREALQRDRTLQRLAARAAWHRGFKNAAYLAETFGCERTSAWRWTRELVPAPPRHGRSSIFVGCRRQRGSRTARSVAERPPWLLGCCRRYPMGHPDRSSGGSPPGLPRSWRRRRRARPRRCERLRTLGHLVAARAAGR